MRRELILGPACAIALLAIPSAAAAKDRNHDGLPDRWERQHKLSLKVKQAHRDQDHDGLRNRDEFRFRLDPRDRDSDDDGRHDDDENTGTVVSFTGGVLTLKLVDGSTLAAKVTRDTEIECEGAGDDHGDDDDRADDRARAASDDDHGHDDHGDDDDAVRGDRASSCGTAALMSGALVHEAEVKTTSAGAVFAEVELVN